MAVQHLKRRLTQQSLLVAVIPFIVSAGFLFGWLLQHVKAENAKYQRQIASIAAFQVETFLTSILNTIRTTVAISLDADKFWYHLQQILEGQIATSKNIKSIYAVSLEGKVMAVGLPERSRSQYSNLIGSDFSKNLPFQNGLNTGKVIWSDTFFSEADGGLSVALAVPSDQMIVIGEVALKPLNDFLTLMSLEKNNLIFVLDRHGQVIADRNGHYTAQRLNIANIALVKKGLSTEHTISGEFEFNHQDMLGHLIRVPAMDWRILIAQPKDNAFGSVKTIFRIVILGLVLALLVGGFLAVFSSRRLASRFESLTSHAHLIAQGEQARRWPKSDIVEFDVLGTSFERMAAAIKERERQLATLMSNLPGLVYRLTFSECRQMLFVSEGARQLIGLSNPQVSEKNERCFNDLIHCEDRLRVWQQIKEDVTRKKSYHVTYRIVTEAEEIKWVSDNGQGVYDSKNIPIALEGFISDVTEGKKMEEQLRQIQKMEAIGVLAGGIAHDFNNLLSPILGYAEIIRDDLPPEHSCHFDLNQIIDAAHRAKKLVNQILTFGRRTEQERCPIQIHSIINEGLELLRASIPTDITICKEIQPCGHVLADPAQIQQVVMNLCTNAYQAMREKGDRLDVVVQEITIDSETMIPDIRLTPGTYLMLEVKDNGNGMDKYTQTRIFDPYFTTKREGEGTGLGLAVVHGIVKRHEGEITVKSKLGEGTRFRVYFPILALEAADDTAADFSGPLPGGSEKILVVDDESAILGMYQKMFTHLGYDVITFGNSAESLRYFEKNSGSVDLVVCDMTMPGLNGAELSKKMLQIRKDLPIIMCTGYSEQINDENAKAIGIRKFVMKPIVKGELALVVRDVLDHG